MGIYIFYIYCSYNFSSHSHSPLSMKPCRECLALGGEIPSLHTPILSVENLNTRHSKCTGQFRTYVLYIVHTYKKICHWRVQVGENVLFNARHVTYMACFSRRHKKSTYSIISGMLYTYIMIFTCECWVDVFATMAKITLKRKKGREPKTKLDMIHVRTTTPLWCTTYLFYLFLFLQFRSFSQAPFSTVPLSAIRL